MQEEKDSLSEKGRPLVWKYSDYRVYLSDCVDWKKAVSSKYSYGYFAKELGTTKSYLKLVTSRKRNMSIDKVIKVSKIFKHSLPERHYFVFLFMENRSDDAEVKAYFRSILKNFTPGGEPRHPVVEPKEEKKYQAMRDWLMLSISGLAACKKYEHDADWIHLQLGGDLIASKAQVQEAMARLKDCGVLVQDNQTWKLNVESQMRSANPFDLDQNQVYKTGLVRSLMAMDLMGKTDVHDPKFFFMNVIAVNKEDQKKVLDLFEEFDKKIWAITHASPNPDRVMLISNNLISLNGSNKS